jgi:pyruvate-ferredoxin/flavodoxin oxidoreductase
VLPVDCFDLEGNPSIDQDWPTYTLQFTNEEGKLDKMEVPLTFADFAVTEGRFRKQFRTVPRDAWNDNLILLADFLKLSADERDGKFPYIWGVNAKNKLIKVVPAQPIVLACEDRRNFWQMLKSLAGLQTQKLDESTIQRIRNEFAHELASKLMVMADGSAASTTVVEAVAQPVAAAIAVPASTGPQTGPWIESAMCTSCDECTGINPRIFAYDEHRHAYVKDAKGGPYKDLVRAAEKCTAQVIHPGSPSDPNEKDLAKLIQRAAKYN